MQRIQDPTASATLVAPPALTGTIGYPQPAVPGVTAATRLRYWYVTMLQEELMSLLTAAGVTPDTTATNFSQVLASINLLISAGAPAVIGSARKALMNVTAASASATFTADEVVVGTTLGGASYALAAYSQAINLATTGAGGMDTGTAPVSGYVALYAIYNPVTKVAGILGTNATSAAAPSVYGGSHMPSGYTASALISVWPTNGSSQFIIGFQRDRKIGFVQVSALTTSTAIGITPVSVSSILPPNAVRAYGQLGGLSTSAGQWSMIVCATLQGAGSQTGVFGVAASEGDFSNFVVEISVAQELFYQLTGSAGTPTATIYLNSYEF
jgi:hypothetical protein